MTADEAIAEFEQAGWERIGVGDWAWVLGAPDRSTVARVTPWDPAYLLFAENCLRHAGNPYLPQIEKVSHLHSEGYIVFMERLQPADPEQATALCLALGLGNDTERTDWLNATAETSAFDGDKDLIQLRRILKETLDYGASHLPFWGGSDIKPEGVMEANNGQLKLVDPCFIRGRAIYEAILNRQGDLLQQISPEALKAFLTIPALADSPDLAELRCAVHSLAADHPD